jgi:hypothetical protein
LSKLVSIRIITYTIDEACERLASLAKHKKSTYSRAGFYNIVRKYKPELIEPIITEAELKFLAGKINKPGRPKIIDNSI